MKKAIVIFSIVLGVLTARADVITNYVYIVSNIPFNEQYRNIQTNEPVTFSAFRRRVHQIDEFLDQSEAVPF